MNKKQKILLVAFGTTDLKKSIKRLQLQAQNSKFYDDIKIFDNESLDKDIKNLIKDKKYTWNSGMFMFKAKTMISEMNKYYPEIIKYCKQAINESTNDLDFKRINEECFKNCPNISFDVSVMEKTQKWK